MNILPTIRSQHSFTSLTTRTKKSRERSYGYTTSEDFHKKNFKMAPNSMPPLTNRHIEGLNLNDEQKEAFKQLPILLLENFSELSAPEMSMEDADMLLKTMETLRTLISLIPGRTPLHAASMIILHLAKKQVKKAVVGEVIDQISTYFNLEKETLTDLYEVQSKIRKCSKMLIPKGNIKN